MSDFDKEAERERLREKYERDQQKREATEQMSELLLKGATMTNGHCDQCGDPIFRYDGQEFCPTCEEVVGGGGETADEDAEAQNGTADQVASGGEADTGSPADAGAADGETERTAADSAAGETGREATETARQATETGQPTAKAGARSGPVERSREAPASTPRSEAATTPSGPSPGTNAPEPTPAATGPTAGQEPAPAGGDGDLATARESLVRTLVAQTRQAEACDDPRRARDHLAAAREAAEALSALSY